MDPIGTDSDGRRRNVRHLLTWSVAVVLVAAVYLQRATIVSAVGHLRDLSAWSLVVLAVLAIAERVSRAEVIRSLLPALTLGRAEVVSDVGSAVSKAVPAGGPVATVLRWQLVRDRGVGGIDFVVMLVASGVATAFVSWALPLVATVVDASRSGADGADIAIIALCAAVIAGSLAFWLVVLGSDSTYEWLMQRFETPLVKLSAIVPSLRARRNGDGDSESRATADEIRGRLRAVGARPFGLLGRTTLAQGIGAIILWVALRSLGVSDELGAAEFARVFFIAHVLGSLAPTPGGVGVIEAGVTGALVAAGVDADIALGAVLVYRFITYVLPILIGATMYLVVRRSLVTGRTSVLSPEWRTRRPRTSEHSTP